MNNICNQSFAHFVDQGLSFDTRWTISDFFDEKWEKSHIGQESCKEEEEEEEETYLQNSHATWNIILCNMRALLQCIQPEIHSGLKNSYFCEIVSLTCFKM